MGMTGFDHLCDILGACRGSLVGLVKLSREILTANKTVNPGVVFCMGFTAMLELTTPVAIAV